MPCCVGVGWLGMYNIYPGIYIIIWVGVRR